MAKKSAIAKAIATGFCLGGGSGTAIMYGKETCIEARLRRTEEWIEGWGTKLIDETNEQQRHIEYVEAQDVRKFNYILKRINKELKPELKEQLLTELRKEIESTKESSSAAKPEQETVDQISKVEILLENAEKGLKEIIEKLEGKMKNYEEDLLKKVSEEFEKRMVEIKKVYDYIPEKELLQETAEVLENLQYYVEDLGSAVEDTLQSLEQSADDHQKALNALNKKIEENQMNLTKWTKWIENQTKSIIEQSIEEVLEKSV